MSSRVDPATAGADASSFLRRVLLADAVVSGLGGLLLAVAPREVAAVIGLRSAVAVAVAGLVLLVYAAGLVRNARRERMRREDAWTTIALNLAWLVATAVVVGAGWLSRQGNWTLLVVADVVLVFAVLEGVGLRRMRGIGSGRAARPAV